jgi:hypothetical protein
MNSYIVGLLVIVTLVLIQGPVIWSQTGGQCPDPSGRVHVRDSGIGGCGCGGLLPITNPWYNLREICKNIILLEDHLFQRRKRCQDCIKKHFLTIEALAEEMVTLDKSRSLKVHYDLADQIRDIEKEYIKHNNDESIHNIAQKLRAIRKGIMYKCFEVV